MPVVIIAGARVPGAPTLTAVTALDAAASVTWAAPLTDGGSPLVLYVVTAVTADGATAASVQVDPAFTTVTLALPNDVAYSVTVAAANGVGTSVPSNALLVTPVAGAGVAPTPDVPVPAPYGPVLQPMVDAFPMDRPFRPENWLLTAEEVDAL